MRQRQNTLLFFTINASGHINPMVRIADRIKRELNCRIIFMTIGPTISLIRDHGHELLELKESRPVTGIDEKTGKQKEYPGIHIWSCIMSNTKRSSNCLSPLEASIEMLTIVAGNYNKVIKNNDANVAQAIKSVNPDLIVADVYIPPLCFIENQDRIPWVRLHSANPISLTRSKLPDGTKPPPLVGARLGSKAERLRLKHEEAGKFEQMLDDWRNTTDILRNFINKTRHFDDDDQRTKTINLERGMFLSSPYLNVYMYPPELDYDQEDDIVDYPARCFRCSSLIEGLGYQPDSSAVQVWSKKLDEAKVGKEAVVFFSLGTIASSDPELSRKYLDILRTDEKRLYVVSKGPNGRQFELDANNMIGDDYVPQSYILSRSDLALIHGGNNSTVECLYYGVPMIVIPAFGDQFDNAQRIEDLGYGERMDLFKCTRAQLINSIDSLLKNQRLRSKMSEISTRMRSRDDLGKLAKMLDELANFKQLDVSRIDELRNETNTSGN